MAGDEGLGKAKLAAYLEDYAFLIHGLLRLQAATGESRWLDQARTLADRMIADFADPQDGGFFFTPGDHESLLARPKDPYDNALPGANSMAVLDLLALFRATKDNRYLEEGAIPRFGRALDVAGGDPSAGRRGDRGFPAAWRGREENREQDDAGLGGRAHGHLTTG